MCRTMILYFSTNNHKRIDTIYLLYVNDSPLTIIRSRFDTNAVCGMCDLVYLEDIKEIVYIYIYGFWLV